MLVTVWSWQIMGRNERATQDSRGPGTAQGCSAGGRSGRDRRGCPTHVFGARGCVRKAPVRAPLWPLREGGADLLLVGRSGGHFHAQTCVSAWQRWSRVQSSRTHSGLGSPCRCPQTPTPLPARSRDVLYVLQIPGWRHGNRQIRLPFKHGSN